MSVWAYRGEDFDAEKELRNLVKTPTDDHEKASGIVSGLHELLLITESGFAGRLGAGAWREVAQGQWLFVEWKFRMITTFLGDGRRQTRDVCLAASEVFTSRTEAARTLDDFVARALDRIRRGKAERWSDEF